MERGWADGRGGGAKQSARLSLSGGPKPRSASEEDVAAAISASLREY